MIFALGIVVFILILVISVAWHELGHFLPAKLFGVKVSQFMVGFGPTMFSRKKGETEYGIKWLLLGGYIRMAAMYRPTASAKAPKKGWTARVAEEAREVSREEIAELKPGGGKAFYTLSAPRKAVVMLGGPTMNLILALGLIGLVGSVIGSYDYTTTVDKVSQCFSTEGATTDECDATTVPGPAWQAGLQPGDKLISWNDQPIKTWEDVIRLVGQSSAGISQLVFERDGQEQSVELTPVQVVEGETTRYLIGVSPRWEIVRKPITDAPKMLGSQIAASAGIYASLPVRVWQTMSDMFQGHERRVDSPLSMVGVARISGEIGQEVGEIPGVDAWRLRWATWLQLAAAVNIALWLFNMLPLLPLDGGHVVNSIFEGVRRTVARRRGREDPGPADSARLMPLSYGVVGALILMTVILVAADVFNPIRF